MGHRLAAAVLLTLLLAGCDRGSGSSDRNTSASPPTGPTASAGSKAKCPDMELLISVHSAPPPVCLTVGAILQVRSDPSPRQPWATLTSSAPDVLDCSSEQRADGSVTAECIARAAGSATVSTVTAPFAGDPQGPPQVRWQATVTVSTD